LDEERRLVVGRLVVAALAAVLVALVCGATAWVALALGRGLLNVWLVGAVVTGLAAVMVIAWWAAGQVWRRGR